jgi:TonB family protein
LLRHIIKKALGCAALLLMFSATNPLPGQEAPRKIKVSVLPEYPELARRMNIQGQSRVLLTVSPDGKVTDVKELGDNPVLLSALVQAVKKWRYERADGPSTIEVRFDFK